MMDPSFVNANARPLTGFDMLLTYVALRAIMGFRLNFRVMSAGASTS